MKPQSIIIFLYFIIFYLNTYGQNYEMSLKNGGQVDGQVFEFDVFIKAIAPTTSFVMSAYQMSLLFNSTFSGSGQLNIIYIPSSSSLSNKPNAALGIFDDNGTLEINIASFVGYDTIGTSQKKIGAFRIENTVPFTHDTAGIKWDFKNDLRTIVLGENFIEITELGNFIDLNYPEPLDSLNSQLAIDIKILLEGAYNPNSGASMSAELGSDIPLTQPFNKAPWNYYGTENVSSIPANITDWLLIELRSDESKIEARKAAFIRNDGIIVNLNGSPFTITANSGFYYIVVHHRNHLSVSSKNKVVL